MSRLPALSSKTNPNLSRPHLLPKSFTGVNRPKLVPTGLEGLFSSFHIGVLGFLPCGVRLMVHRYIAPSRVAVERAQEATAAAGFHSFIVSLPVLASLSAAAQT
jgi:hypothetical protein